MVVGTLKTLAALARRNDVVLQRLAVDRLDAEGHLRLVIDDDELAVLRGQDFELPDST